MNTAKQLDLLEQTPDELLTDVTKKPDEQKQEAPNLGQIFEHTEQSPFTDFSRQTNEPINAQNGQNGGPTVLPGTQGDTLNVGKLFSAELSVNLADMIMPAVIVAILKATKGVEVSKGRFAATKAEKDVIKPVLQKYLDSINLDMGSPLNALIITLAVVYGSKTVEVLNEPGLTRTVKPEAGQPATRKSGQFTSLNQPAGRGRKPKR